MTFCRRRWRSAAGEIHDQLSAFHGVEAAYDRFFLFAGLSSLPLPSGVSTRLDEVEVPWGIAARDSEDKLLPRTSVRLPSRRLDLLICRNFLERMTGLEATTFCMARASAYLTPFSHAYEIRRFYVVKGAWIARIGGGRSGGRGRA
jgi:hypothetical protein